MITLTKTLILLFIHNIFIQQALPEVSPYKFWNLLESPAASYPRLVRSLDAPTAKPIKLPEKRQHLKHSKAKAIFNGKQKIINQNVPWCSDTMVKQSSVVNLVLDSSRVFGLPDETHPPVIASLAKYHQVKCGAGCKKDASFIQRGFHPLLDDPGRFLGTEFDLLETTYVIEVVGEHDGLDEATPRVMFGQESFPYHHFPLNLETTDLVLTQEKTVQRISFNLGVHVIVCRNDAEGKTTLQLPMVVPHVIFYYHYKGRATPSSDRITEGRAMLEMYLPPMTLTATINEDCDGLTMKSDQLNGNNVHIRIRPGNKQDSARVAANLQEVIDKKQLVEAYVNQVDKFFSKLLQEILQQRNNVIHRNEVLEEICSNRTIE